MIKPMTRTRPIGPADVAVAVAVVALGVVLMVENAVSAEFDASWVVVPAFLLVTVPVLWRRAAPLPALGAVFVGLVLNVALTGQVVRCGVVFPETWLLVYSAGARLQRREATAALVVGLAALLVMTLDDGAVGPDVLLMFGPVTVVIWGIGRVVQARGEMVEELQAQTLQLRQARDDRARLEVATDRARLSAELDTLLHRRLGELARMADAGRQETDAATATATLVDIETASRRTLEEMRAVVGVLRHDAAGAPTAPQPTLTHLEAMLVRAKGAGARLEIEGSPRVLPAGVELSAYRVVEHLLDAVEDAGDVDVRVRFGDDALELTVSGPARRRGDAAIERARERVELHRGTLTSSLRAGRAEATAQLPLAAGV